MYNLFELRDFQRYFKIIIMQISKLLVNKAKMNLFFDLKLIDN